VHKHAFPVAKGQLKITMKLAELINPTITSSDVYYTTHFTLCLGTLSVECIT